MTDPASALPSGADGRPPALELRQIHHHFGQRHALRGATLAVEENEIVALVGPSGCGKSTLLRIAAGLETLQHGEVWIDGARVADSRTGVPPEQRKVGLVFQDYALFPHLTVLENVRFGLPARERRSANGPTLDLLTQFGIAEYARAYPNNLSGGQQQRAALARALAPQPRLLLLDEPFSSLDYQLRAQTRDETRQLVRRSRIATLLVTHDPEEALCFADRVALMQDGTILQAGSPADLYFRPVSAFAARFFGDTNSLAGRVRAGGIETPFGKIGADGMAEGQTVEILIRPEAIYLPSPTDPNPLRASLRIQSTQLTGTSALVDVAAAGENPINLKARLPPRAIPAIGHLATMAIDLSGFFVFPAPGAGESHIGAN